MSASKLLNMDCADRYHPIAMGQAIADLVKEFPKRLQNDSAHFYSVLDRARQEVGGQSPLELEETAWQTKMALIHHDFAPQKGRVILDAHLLPIGRRGPDASDDFAGEWAIAGPVFIYFGENAFPSPYPGSGINGVYVEIRPKENDSCPAVRFKFTLSPEIVPFEEAGNLNPDNRAKDVLLHGRVYTFMASADEPYGAVNWSDPYPIYIGDDFTVDRMLPHIQEPMLHAWRTLKAYMSGDVDVTLACDEEIVGGERRRAAKIATIEEFRDFNERVSECRLEPLVAVLHGPNQPASLLPFYYQDEDRERDPPNLDLEELLQWVDYFACRASTTKGEAKAWFGSEMVRLLEFHQDLTLTDSELEFFALNLDLGHAYKLQGKIETEDGMGIRVCVECAPAATCLPLYQALRVTTLATMEEYSQMRAELDAYPATGTAMAWARVIAGCVENSSELAEAVEEAMEANPLVPAILSSEVGKYSHLDPFNMATDSPLADAIQAALVLREAWEELEIAIRVGPNMLVLSPGRLALAAARDEPDVMAMQ